jgi:hypothetical protein
LAHRSWTVARHHGDAVVKPIATEDNPDGPFFAKVR